jgi:hypothetical protein
MPEVCPPRASPLPQVLVGEMPPLVRDLVRVALLDANVEVIEDEDALRPGVPCGPPSIAIVADGGGARAWERAWLRNRPDMIVLGVERHGRTLAISVLRPCRNDLGELTARTLATALSLTPTWDERFA